jgi:hypothetical protein
VHTKSGAPCASCATIRQRGPSRSIVMKPKRLVATSVDIVDPGAGTTPAGNGCGSGVSIQSPPLPETNCVGCGVEKLTTSNRWTWPDNSAFTLGG